MKDHKLKVLDQLASDTQFGQEPVSYVYGTCSCGQRLQGARSEDELRENHKAHAKEEAG